MLKLRPNARLQPPRKLQRKLPLRRRGRARLRPRPRNPRLRRLPPVLESRPQGNPFPLGLRPPRNPLWFLRPENLLRQLVIRLSQRLRSLPRLRLPGFRGTRPLPRHRVAPRQLARRVLRSRRASALAFLRQCGLQHRVLRHAPASRPRIRERPALLRHRAIHSVPVLQQAREDPCLRAPASQCPGGPEPGPCARGNCLRRRCLQKPSLASPSMRESLRRARGLWLISANSKASANFIPYARVPAWASDVRGRPPRLSFRCRASRVKSPSRKVSRSATWPKSSTFAPRTF